MTEYRNNDATQLAEDAFFDFEYDSMKPVGVEYIKNLDVVTTFYEYVLKYAKKCGYDGEDHDANKLANFIVKEGKKRNAPLSSLETVKNWLKSAPPSADQRGRENVYKLCFALGLNAKETKEIFFKAYLERPFNYKNIHEAVYFFCLKSGLGYSEAERIIYIIENEEIVDNPDAIDVTEQIGNDLKCITDETAFIKYIRENRSGFSVQNQTAIDEIEDLREYCYGLATQEEEKTVDNIDSLLAVICGFHARRTKKAETNSESENKDEQKKKREKVLKKSIKFSDFPDAITTNFPQRQQFQNIFSGKATFDVIRKALIMLKFYSFFAELQMSDAEDIEYTYIFDEFVNETNGLLAKCGYVQLYWRNPYDWMFGYCANAIDSDEDPLDQFRMLIEEFYLNKDIETV